MRVELTIRHDDTNGDNLARVLEEKFGARDEHSLARSPLFSTNLAAWSNSVRFCAETPQSRVICVSPKSDELQAVIEPLSGRLDLIFDSAWDGLRTSLRTLHPTLVSAAQIDESTNQTIQVGNVGLSTEARQKEIVLPLTLAVASTVWIAIGLLTFVEEARWKFVGGSLTTMVGGIIALLVLARNCKRRRIRWTGTQ